MKYKSETGKEAAAKVEMRGESDLALDGTVKKKRSKQV